MTMMADAVIAALRDSHDELAAVASGLTGEQLRGPSGAAKWDVSQVLSHLGSGAVITRMTLDAAVAGRPGLGQDDMRAVWARWDGMGAEDRRDESLAENATLLAVYDALGTDTRSSLRIDLGFLPQPVDLATAATMRLSEHALHSWDVRVALDPAATLNADAVPPLVDAPAMSLEWLATTEPLQGRRVDVEVSLTGPERRFALVLAETASLGEAPAEPTAYLSLAGEAWLRLVAGRLAPGHTPQGTEVRGDVTLDELRQVFPGY